MGQRDVDGDRFADLVAIKPDGTQWLLTINPYASSTDAILDTPVRIGAGWATMTTVASPGSLDGDRWSDLVVRRNDGNLYRYTNAHGRWKPAVRIRTNWKGMRLLG